MVLILVSGCSTASYLWQATRGQLKLSSRMRPLLEVLQDPRVPRETQQILATIPRVKKFAQEHGLKRTRNYEHFVQWDDDALVWVVSATPELSFENKTWNFPIVGQVPYLGFFEKRQAQEYEKLLRAEGWETDLRGAAAYSSLGYFQDPVVSTLWNKEDPLARALVAHTVLHESVHSTLYLRNQTDLNESVAEFLASELLPLYLKHEAPELLADWEKRGEQRLALSGKLLEAFQQLDAIYKDPLLGENQKREKKAQLLGNLSTEKRRWNNPMLAQYRTYHDARGQWRRLWVLCGHSPLRLLRRLEKLDHQENLQTLSQRLASIDLCSDSPL